MQTLFRNFVFRKFAVAAPALAALALLASSPAQAQNLVKDGNFEQADPGALFGVGDFTNGAPFDTHWVITSGVVGIDTANIFVYKGDKSLFLSDGTDGTDAVTQNLATETGKFYTLSFYADSDFEGATLNVRFGDTVLDPIVVPNNGFDGPNGANKKLFTPYSFLVAATTPFTGLTFSTSTTEETLELDNIKVTAAAVPEASTLVSLSLLLLLGLGGMRGCLTKRHSGNNGLSYRQSVIL